MTNSNNITIDGCYINGFLRRAFEAIDGNNYNITITNNDIIPFFPIHFDDFPKCPVTELWVGPRNKIRHDDLFLYLHKNGYLNTKIYYSDITYR